nr:callose synthase 5-like [Tanacetum cinerariifolium]
KDIEAKQVIYAPYNILPLDSAGESQCIMQFDEKDNVRNQREHLILQLAHPQARLMPKPDPVDKLDDRAVDIVMTKLFKNYKTWCKYIGKKHSVRLPKAKHEVQQRKLLYMGLYLLIWGEAANVRFMPECVCYIFHNVSISLVS